MLNPSSIQSLCSRGIQTCANYRQAGTLFVFDVKTMVSIRERKNGTKKNVRREKGQNEGSKRLNGFQSR